MAKRIATFNHKGGVSKTTSTYNIGWMMSKNHRVLLVDADPQCNLSSLIMGDDFESYFYDPSTAQQNIKDGVAPAFSGKPNPIEAVACVSPARAPNLFLLPGHANLSEYDAALTFAQTANNAISALQNLPGAFSRLIELTEQRYSIDYTLIDMSPALSSINQNLFLVSNGFMVPTNPDPFSLMALETLRSILPRWSSWKLDAVDLFRESAYPLPAGDPKFLGAIVQRFNVRKGRAARPYRDNIDEIKNKLSETLVPAFARRNMALNSSEYGHSLVDNQYCLAEIPDFQGLLPKAYEVGVPVFEIQDDEIGATGPILAGFKDKRDFFAAMFRDIADQIIRLASYA